MIKVYNEKFVEYGYIKEFQDLESVKLRYGSTINDGLLFHAKFNDLNNITETGQTITINNVEKAKIDNIDCLHFNTSSSYITSDFKGISNNVSSSQCIWLCSNDSSVGSETSVNNFIMYISSSGDADYSRRLIGSFYTQIPTIIVFNLKSSSIVSTTNVYDNKWHFVVATHDEQTNVNNLYVDGNLEATNIQQIYTNPSQLIFAKNAVNGNLQYYGYLADARIYDRVLTTREIKILYKLFNK